jgi:hypothetical protein
MPIAGIPRGVIVAPRVICRHQAGAAHQAVDARFPTVFAVRVFAGGKFLCAPEERPNTPFHRRANVAPVLVALARAGGFICHRVGPR